MSPPPAICKHSIPPTLPLRSQRCHSDGQQPDPDFPLFLRARRLNTRHQEPANEWQAPGAKQKSATALANPLGGGAGDAPFGHPIRCSSASLPTLTGCGRPTCTANRGVNGRTLDVASESVAPALLSAVWGEGNQPLFVRPRHWPTSLPLSQPWNLPVRLPSC